MFYNLRWTPTQMVAFVYMYVRVFVRVFERACMSVC